MIKEEKQGEKIMTQAFKHPYLNPSFVVEEEKKSANHSLLTIKPLENGYGHTLGNAMRRVLLSSLVGSALTSVQIESVDHQFSTIEGVKEDIVEILLNLKQVRIRADGNPAGVARIDAKGPGEVTAADIKCEAGFEVINPKQHIASITKKTELSMELKIDSGIGYQVGDQIDDKEIGELMIDATFSPVLTVSYKVESTRVGRRTDYDKLLLDVKTDGSLTPMEAVEQAARILERQFKQVFEPTVIQEVEEPEDISPEEAEVLRLTVEELDLPTRIANALRKGGYKTVADLSKAQREEVEKIKNIGAKSASIVESALEKKGVVLKG